MMDVVEGWTGRSACALQKALHEPNEGFAELLDVAVRTVAAWHADPRIEPRPETQQALDTVYGRADVAVRQRFARILAQSVTGVQAQALRVAIAVVVRGGEVLLVCRRGDDALRWQFPAGVVKPGASPATVAEQETHAETGVHCSVREHLGSRLHPSTGVMADYHLCDYLAGVAANADQIENVDVQWVPIGALTRFISTDKLYPPIKTALEALA